MEDHGMAGIAEKCLPGLGVVQNPLAALDAEIALEADMLGNEAHHRLGVMGVEIVHHEVCLPVVLKHGGEMCGEVLFGTGLTDVGEYLTGSDVEAGDKRAGAVADVLELPSFDASRLQRQRWGNPLEGLDTGQFVDAEGGNGRGGALRSQAIGLADVVTFLGKANIGFGIKPAAYAMGLEVGIFLKCARPSAAKCRERCRV